ncbi:MAG: DUF2975 domain-containing protein [Lachnospiraceae bacterium]
MKEQAIQKINKIGKISNIITLIAKILVGIALGVALVGAVICFVIPDSMLKFNMQGTMNMELDYSSLGISMTEEEMAVAQAEVERGPISDEATTITEIAVTENKIIIAGDTDYISFTMRDAAWLAVLALGVLAMTFVTLVFIGALCKAFRDCHSPFEENVIKKMQNLAVSLIPWAVVSAVSGSVANSLLHQKVNIMFSIDLGVILIALVVLVLVYIFKYGAVLQQESDETL